jgi:hypothetical protein
MHLEGIEVTWSSPLTPDVSLPAVAIYGQENASCLEENHPSLRKVYYVGRGSHRAEMWERTDCWRMRSVCVLNGIDMISEDFDKL